MAKTDPPPADEPTPEATPEPEAPPSRAEILAATEAGNAARAMDGHVAPKHIDGATLTED